MKPFSLARASPGRGLEAARISPAYADAWK
jgi:hypothetical protein